MKLKSHVIEGVKTTRSKRLRKRECMEAAKIGPDPRGGGGGGGGMEAAKIGPDPPPPPPKKKPTSVVHKDHL